MVSLFFCQFKIQSKLNYHFLRYIIIEFIFMEGYLMKVEQSIIPKQNYITNDRPKEKVVPTSAVILNHGQGKGQGTVSVNSDEDQISNEEIEKKVNSLNKFIEASSSKVKFQYHEQLGEYFVQLVDSTTNEVVKEIPPKKMLDMYAEMLDIMGIFVDRKV